MPDPQDAEVVVIGGGAAGLATASCLQRRGVRPVVLDKGEYLGQSWAERYDRLRLHTPRIQSHLPGYRLPARAGRWVARDDVVGYLQDYAAHLRIDVRSGVEVTAVTPAPGGWRVTGGGVDATTSHVVFATGLNGVPLTPSWPGVTSFTGEVLHAAAYRNALPYQGRDVLVVGVGNSGAEIATDLALGGAGRVWLAVRTPPHVIPLMVGPVPSTLLGILQSLLPPALVDPVNRRLARARTGDLAAFGLPAPEEGLSARMRRLGGTPTIDVGLLEQLRAGRVEVVPAVTSFQGRDVALADGRRLQPDAVIAATGYTPGAAGLLAGLDRTRPGLHTVGLTPSQKGLLFQINLDARRVARTVARQVADRRRRERRLGVKEKSTRHRWRRPMFRTGQ